MSATLLLARHALGEALRSKVAATIFAFATLLVLGGRALAGLAPDEEARLTRDLGLGAISLLGLALAIYLGTTTVAREVDRRTAHLLLARPIARHQLVVGKSLGVAAALALEVALLGALLALALLLADARVDGTLVIALALRWMELVVVAAIALLLSTVASPFVAGFATAATWIVGRALPDLRALALRGIDSGVGRSVVGGLLRVVPDLRLFVAAENNRDAIWALGYGALYATSAVAVAAWVFARRDLP